MSRKQATNSTAPHYECATASIDNEARQKVRAEAERRKKAMHKEKIETVADLDELIENIGAVLEENAYLIESEK